MKLAFINLPSQELERPPAAAALLTGIVKDRLKWQTKIFDFNMFLNSEVPKPTWLKLESFWRCTSLNLDIDTEKYLDKAISKFVKIIKKFEPNWIAISVFTHLSIIPCYVLLKTLRKEFEKSKIFIGGQGINNVIPETITTIKNDVIENPSFAKAMLSKKLIDYFIAGDGEDSVVELLNGNENFPGINGSAPVQVTSLDNLPFPDYSDTKPLDYFYTNEPGVYITASKGCVRRCTFCNVPDLFPKFVTRSPTSLIMEIQNNKNNYGVNLTHFTDSLINGSMKHFREFNQLMCDLKNKNKEMTSLKFMGQFICRTMDEQNENDWRLMAKAGLDLIVVGFESYSEKVRYHMGKKYSNDDIKFHLAQSGYYGIKNIALMFVGYPIETIEDHEMNKKFLHDYKKFAQSGIIHMIRWGYTGSFTQKDKIEKPGHVKMIFDPYLENKFKNLPFGLMKKALSFGWINEYNPSLTLKERIRRRLELHDLSVKLGWPQTRSKEELTMLYNILKNFKDNEFDIRSLENLETLTDFH